MADRRHIASCLQKPQGRQGPLPGISIPVTIPLPGIGQRRLTPIIGLLLFDSSELLSGRY